MTQNPYAPVLPSQAIGPISTKAHRWSTVLPHVVGVLSFVFGLGSFFVLSQIPAVHPALGGPDPGRVLLVLLALAFGCAFFSIVLAINSLYSCRFIRMLYAAPPLAFVGYIVLQFIKLQA